MICACTPPSDTQSTYTMCHVSSLAFRFIYSASFNRERVELQIHTHVHTLGSLILALFFGFAYLHLYDPKCTRE